MVTLKSVLRKRQNLDVLNEEEKGISELRKLKKEHDKYFRDIKELGQELYMFGFRFNEFEKEKEKTNATELIKIIKKIQKRLNNGNSNFNNMIKKIKEEIK